ncbi:hypothetical protein TCAL_07516 [Tigriopus californicus]|uniref:STAS domain-containing protein n=1 Tax=Tigriopus californicus TaxID=6832 RepID=A0A553NXQ9_TIGCA|nr:solute carrier family 26 member 10-like [Tigriopus californicus]TRY70210.1 hypothetical protein TCAL_07516 [Tigriopus californicus]|eukprot:TCALIF_07516-PA protein Name:"Similar to SULTR2 Proton/sulfate cotransporter 2 (Chlamydomonas reinhardtii)" AED:0.21 eAED:0.21 QI:0/1/0.66/1/1/1/3/62/237
MLMQFHDFPKFYKNSKLDGLLWLVTFIAVIVLDIDSGLIIGIAVALLVLLFRSISTNIQEVGPVPETGLVVEIKESEFAIRPREAVILRISGAINFANFESVIDRLRKKVLKLQSEDRKLVVLDISNVPYMDQTGAKKMCLWLKEDKGSERVLAAPTGKVERMLKRFEVDPNKLYPTVMDALLKKSLSGINPATTKTDPNSLEKEHTDHGEDNRGFQGQSEEVKTPTNTFDQGDTQL